MHPRGVGGCAAGWCGCVVARRRDGMAAARRPSRPVSPGSVLVGAGDRRRVARRERIPLRTSSDPSGRITALTVSRRLRHGRRRPSAFPSALAEYSSAPGVHGQGSWGTSPACLGDAPSAASGLAGSRWRRGRRATPTRGPPRPEGRIGCRVVVVSTCPRGRSGEGEVAADLDGVLVVGGGHRGEVDADSNPLTCGRGEGERPCGRARSVRHAPRRGWRAASARRPPRRPGWHPSARVPRGRGRRPCARGGGRAVGDHQLRRGTRAATLRAPRRAAGAPPPMPSRGWARARRRCGLAARAGGDLRDRGVELLGEVLQGDVEAGDGQGRVGAVERGEVAFDQPGGVTCGAGNGEPSSGVVVCVVCWAAAQRRHRVLLVHQKHRVVSRRRSGLGFQACSRMDVQGVSCTSTSCARPASSWCAQSRCVRGHAVQQRVRGDGGVVEHARRPARAPAGSRR